MFLLFNIYIFVVKTIVHYNKNYIPSHFQQYCPRSIVALFAEFHKLYQLALSAQISLAKRQVRTKKFCLYSYIQLQSYYNMIYIRIDYIKFLIQAVQTFPFSLKPSNITLFYFYHGYKYIFFCHSLFLIKILTNQLLSY